MALDNGVNVYASIGTLSEFRVGDNWELYQERMEQYFMANFVADIRKVSVLLTLIGQDTYKILCDLCDPVLPKEKTFGELCDILKKVFT